MRVALVFAEQAVLFDILSVPAAAQEDDVRAVLDIPEDVNTWAMIPMGYPTGRWGEAARRPVREVTYWDSWRNPPPG